MAIEPLGSSPTQYRKLQEQYERLYSRYIDLERRMQDSRIGIEKALEFMEVPEDESVIIDGAIEVDCSQLESNRQRILQLGIAVEQLRVIVRQLK